jgi:hypothetical protein
MSYTIIANTVIDGFTALFQFDLLLGNRYVSQCRAWELGLFKDYEDLTISTPESNSIFINSEIYVVDLITRNLIGIGQLPFSLPGYKGEMFNKSEDLIFTFNKNNV